MAHHVTQRGNAKRYILDTDADRTVYLGLLLEKSEPVSSFIGGVMLRGHVKPVGEQKAIL